MKYARIGVLVLTLSISALFLSYGQPAKPEASTLSPGGRGESAEQGETIERKVATAGKSEASRPIPLRRVILYTNGTAYLERELEVSGQGMRN